MVDDGKLKIIDFDVSRKITSESGIMITHKGMGTNFYRAPEVSTPEGEKVFSEKSDMYSLGVVVFRLAMPKADYYEEEREAYLS